MARLLSVNVGLPRDIDWRGRTVHTGIWKEPSRDAARCDGSTSTATGRAISPVTAASIARCSSIRSSRIATGRSGWAAATSPTGSSARTSRSRDCPTTRCAIGDRYRIGTALFEVTQPRVTCYRVGIRMDEPQMAALLTSSGRPGFYLRVLEEGEVGAGDPIVKVGGAERMTIAEVNALLYRPVIHAINSSARSASRRCPRAGGGRSRRWSTRRGGPATPGCARGGRPRPGFRPDAGLADRSRERRRDLVLAAADGWPPAGTAAPRPVRRPPVAPEPTGAAVPELFTLGRPLASTIG